MRVFLSSMNFFVFFFFFFQAEDGIRDWSVTGVQTCALPISDDIYSLGASVYELLTSKPPFYSGNIDRQICERVAPSMTQRRKELDIEPAFVPQLWEDVVAACLAKDPSRRPQSASEVAHQLQLTPASIGTRVAPGKSPSRKALLVSAIAVLCVLALA